MGTCYSKKASGGNHSYTTVHMASTKLDDASRLARATPYTRTPNANMEISVKKSIPLSTKYSPAVNMDQNDLKNVKNNYQSSIPRFSSSLPVSSIATDQKVVTNGNDNETLHVVNNNSTVNPRSTSNMLSTPSSSKLSNEELQTKSKSLGSRSCPDKIANSGNVEKPPRRVFGIARQLFSRSSQSLQNSPDIHNAGKLPSVQESKSKGKISNAASPVSKSPSGKTSVSRDSLSDFDSGLGNSLNDKNKPEDSDTVKDLEQIEFNEEFSPNINVNACPSRPTSTPKPLVPNSKLSLKAPIYKREPNGKWSLDENHFGSETVRTVDPKPLSSSGRDSPRDKHSFKMNASENIFSTYASYKGLLSYQKKSFKPSDVKSNLRANTPEKSSQLPSSSIPKVRRQFSQTSANSVFYVSNENIKGTEALKAERKQEYQLNHSKQQSSPDSDEKTDTENGVLSPPSDGGVFLIDDEIADQPGLTFDDPLSEQSDVQSLKLAMSELHALQMSSSTSKKRTESVSSYNSRKGHNENRDSLILGSELGSSCSSIASDDLMLDYEKSFDGFPEGTINEGLASPMRKISEAEPDKVAPLKSEKRFDFEGNTRKRLHRRSSGPLSTAADRLEWRQRTVSLPLRPPRQMTISEADDGGLKLDSSSYRLLCQDLNGVKTLLLRLKTVIQEAETMNPFDQTNPNNIFYHSLAQADFPTSLINLSSSNGENKVPDPAALFEENADLKRQIVLLQQQMEDKDHTIHLLQQQMTKYLNIQPVCDHDASQVNSATQTERSHSLSGSFTSNASADDSIETLVSAQDDFEQSFRKNSKAKDVLSGHLNKVVRLLDHPITSQNYSEC